MATKTLSLVLVLLASCAAGSESPPPDPGTRYDSLETFCAARARAECSDVVVQKCKSKGRDACVAARTDHCKGSMPQGVRYNPAGADACIRAVTDAYADAKLSAAESANIDDACGPKVFVGKGTARDRCESNWDCDASVGLVCMRAYGKDEGKCLVPHVVEPASSCADEADVCPSDSYCDTMTKVCVPKHASGESCQPGYIECVDTAVCAGGGPFGGGCRDKLQDGDTCAQSIDCMNGLCEKPTGAAMGTCSASLELSPLSAACTGFGS
jgi:hypothetical protein